MELVTLHDTPLSATPSKKEPKVYKRYQIASSAEAILSCGDIYEELEDCEEDKKMKFFYIGKNPVKRDFVINTFTRGYTAENVEKSASIIERIFEEDSTPEFVIVEGAVGEAAMMQLHRLLSGNPNFSKVPIIMDASDITNEADLRKLTGLQFVDEIISLDESDTDKLITKVQFLKKIKSKPNKQQLKPTIETSVEGITGRKSFGKRLFDIIVSSLAIIILSPLLFLIALVIKLESRGPVLYVAQRAGRGYRIFDFYKFRTMIMDADQKVEQLSHLNQYDSKAEAGPVFFKISNDPRITRVGQFLRNTSLDELPQLFNVLLGDMSLVGNRPLPLYEAATLTTDEWAARFLAPAGITGLWQITKRGHNSMSVEERIKLDIAYADNYSFTYDLLIMAKTPFALIQKSNV
jgi:lipopolysaccharide/colanic/teichoic acid biosynthesis glycosyltransferase